MNTFSVQSRLEEIRKPPNPAEPKQSRVITVRLPRDQHERLKELAHKQEVSLNQLCLVALEGVEAGLCESRATA